MVPKILLKTASAYCEMIYDMFTQSNQGCVNMIDLSKNVIFSQIHNYFDVAKYKYDGEGVLNQMEIAKKPVKFNQFVIVLWQDINHEM